LRCSCAELVNGIENAVEQIGGTKIAVGSHTG
jgi:hypothetical protein